MKPYLKKYENEKIIIYTNSRKETAKIADMINEYMSTRTKKELFIQAYHAGMSKNLGKEFKKNLVVDNLM